MAIEPQAAATPAPAPAAAPAPAPAAAPALSLPAELAPAPAPAAIPEVPAAPAAAPVPPADGKPEPKAGDPPAGQEPAAKPEPPDHAKVKSLLSEAGDEPKPAPKPGEPKVPEQPGGEAAKPTYNFTFPEGIQVEAKSLEPYTAALQEAGIAPEIGQKFLDMHIGEVTRLQADTLRQQHEDFGNMRRGWRALILADEQLGGAGHQTAMKAVARARDLAVPPDRRAAFDEAMAITGAGDHPEIIRAFYNLAKFLDEPAPLPTNFRPPKDIGGKPGSRRERMYDHPSSNKRAGG